MWRMFRRRRWLRSRNRKLGFTAFALRGRYMRPPDGDGDGDGGGSGGGGSGGSSGDGAGDGDGDGDGDGSGGSGGGAGKSKSFTQDDVNRIVKKEKGRVEVAYKAKLQEQLDRVNELSEEKDLTDKQREQLASQKAELQASLMSEKERSEAEKTKANKDHAKALEGVTQERNGWRVQYESQLTETAILAAADKHEAYNTTQLVALVSPLTHVVPIKDEKGEEVPGKFHPVVKTVVKDDEGKLVEKELSVDAYVEYLRGQKEHENLFVSKRPGGTGHRQGSGAGSKGGAERTAIQKITDGLKEGQATRSTASS